MNNSHAGINTHCPSLKLISHTITLPTIHNDDVSHRLLGIVLPFQELVAAPIAIQDHPSPAMIAGQDSFQVTIVQHDDMIQAMPIERDQRHAYR
jgi:hypothetical protein